MTARADIALAAGEAIAGAVTLAAAAGGQVFRAMVFRAMMDREIQR